MKFQLLVLVFIFALVASDKESDNDKCTALFYIAGYNDQCEEEKKENDLECLKNKIKDNKSETALKDRKDLETIDKYCEDIEEYKGVDCSNYGGESLFNTLENICKTNNL